MAEGAVDVRGGVLPCDFRLRIRAIFASLTARAGDGREAGWEGQSADRLSSALCETAVHKKGPEIGALVIARNFENQNPVLAIAMFAISVQWLTPMSPILGLQCQKSMRLPLSG